jgi:hypothetical protein
MAEERSKVLARVLTEVDDSSVIDKATIVPVKKLDAIKQGAKLDPKLTALVQRLKALSKETDHGPGHIRIMPKKMPNPQNCACGCDCC